MPTPSIRNLASAGRAIPGPWQPRIAGEVNGHQVKVARFEGDFDWHSHAEEDEAFLVMEGRIAIDFREGAIELGTGDFVVVPRGTEHRPRSLTKDAIVAMFEPGSTINTGGEVTARKGKITGSVPHIINSMM